MAKGGGFEREMCKQLSLWWSKGASDSVFWRTSNSGGRATVRHGKNRATKNQHGDVCATDPDGQPFVDAFLVELKRGYNRHTVHDLLDRSDGAKVQTVEGWVAKSKRSADLSGAKSWMVVHRRDRREAVVLVPAHVYRDVAVVDTAVLPFAEFAFDIRDSDGGSWCVRVVGMRLGDFFRAFSPDAVREFAKTGGKP